MRNYINAEGEEVALDGEHEFDLAFCYRRMKAWRSWYFRTNSARKAVIQLRQRYEIGEMQPFTKQWIELWLDHKLEEQHRVRDEAYDVLVRDKKQEEIGGRNNIIFTTLETFIPQKKVTHTLK